MKPVDTLDQLAEFVDKLPGWVGMDGFPLSWKHFSYGLAYIRRADARKKIDDSSSIRIGKADDQSYTNWRSGLDAVAGY